MKVCESNQYSPAYPEKFNWELILSIKMTPVATALARQIERELSESPDKRINVPGLRYALNTMAASAEID